MPGVHWEPHSQMTDAAVRYCKTGSIVRLHAGIKAIRRAERPGPLHISTLVSRPLGIPAQAGPRCFAAHNLLHGYSIYSVRIADPVHLITRYP